MARQEKEQVKSNGSAGLQGNGSAGRVAVAEPKAAKAGARKGVPSQVSAVMGETRD